MFERRWPRAVAGRDFFRARQQRTSGRLTADACSNLQPSELSGANRVVRAKSDIGGGGGQSRAVGGCGGGMCRRWGMPGDSWSRFPGVAGGIRASVAPPNGIWAAAAHRRHPPTWSPGGELRDALLRPSCTVPETFMGHRWWELGWGTIPWNACLVGDGHGRL